MTSILAIVAIGLLWEFLIGEPTFFNFLVGALLGMLMLSVIQRGEERSFAQRVLGVLRFLLRFAYELLVSNVMVALLALRPRPRFHPHIIAVPLRLESDLAITLLSAAITLLPGTVAMGVSDDRSLLYAHAITEADPEDSRASVTRIEELILGFMT